MRIIVAGYGDTLRKIAMRTNLSPERLSLWNPHIHGLDTNIEGQVITFRDQEHDTSFISPCPIPPPVQKMEYWIPTTSLEQMAKSEYDVLIVGTGAGGGAALWRLCERWAGSDKRLGIIERGSPIIPTNAHNIPTLDSFRIERYLETMYTPVTDQQSTFKGANQVYALGGRTLFWNAVSIRGFNGALAQGVVPLEQMLQYYEIAEQAMQVNQNYAQGSSVSEILLSRLQKGGFPQASYLPLATDLQQSIYGEIHTNFFFSSLIFLARALNSNPFDLGIQARATRVLTENGRAAGIEVISGDKKQYKIRAKTVVLATSTFETPRILLYSGLGGRAVGHYLETHSFLTSYGIMNRNDFPENLGALMLLIPQIVGNEYQIEVHGPGKYEWYHYEVQPLMKKFQVRLSGIGVIESRYENRVELVPYIKDEDGIPQLQIHFSYSPKDISVIKQTAASMRKAIKTMGMTFPANVQDVCLMPPGTVSHQVGTCRMGNDPETSVTNQYSEVHGTPGLFISDNSVISQNGAANPTLTCIALAIRTADYITERS